jgi:hypothetical protein
MSEYNIPFNYVPREYQKPLFNSIADGFKRIVAVWHRRAGKDKTLLNLAVKEMVKKPIIVYYFFPTYAQGKKILWDGMDKEGFRFLDHFPKDLLLKVNDQEMKIMLRSKGGVSIFQVIGTDKIDSIVGTNAWLQIYSEYSLQNPQAWALMRPILAENDGVAIFNYTPRGANHGKTLYESAKNDPKWFCQKLTVEDTGVLSKEQLEQERLEIMRENGGDDALFWQEYYCNFDVPIQGSYYGKLMQELEKNNQITNIDYDPRFPVFTAWDLGASDSTVIWFWQRSGNQFHFIDYYENHSEGIKHFVDVLNARKYTYGGHYVPHDALHKVQGRTSTKSRLEMFREFGYDMKVLPALSIEDGIQAARAVLPLCYFDAVKCEVGMNCLRNYHREFDEKNKVYRNTPVHDWSSHGSDAFRYFAMAPENKPEEKIKLNLTNYRPLGGV